MRLRVSISFVQLLALIAALPFAACGRSVNTSVSSPGSGPVPPDYPPTIVESTEHRDAMKAEWLRLLESYGVPAERRKAPDLQPVTHTPHSILGIGPIRIGTAGAAQLDEERLRLLLRDFVAKNAQVFGVNASRLSLEGVSDGGSFGKRYSFVQQDYAHPIVPPAGRLEIIASPAGDIVQITDTAIPAVQLPTTPTVTREAAGKRVLGMTFTYGDIAGRPQSVTISDPAEISVTDLMVYPEQLETALRIRLVWVVKAGTSLGWTVYVDAVTGDVVGQRQDFQT
jgi:hypothetical protein